MKEWEAHQREKEEKSYAELGNLSEEDLVSEFENGTTLQVYRNSLIKLMQRCMVIRMEFILLNLQMPFNSKPFCCLPSLCKPGGVPAAAAAATEYTLTKSKLQAERDAQIAAKHGRIQEGDANNSVANVASNSRLECGFGREWVATGLLWYGLVW